jgi:hypothetical protein
MCQGLPGEIVPHNRLTLHGELGEWSLGALGWLAAFVGDGARRAGANGPLTLAVQRVDG